MLKKENVEDVEEELMKFKSGVLESAETWGQDGEEK